MTKCSLIKTLTGDEISFKLLLLVWGMNEANLIGRNKEKVFISLVQDQTKKKVKLTIKQN